MPKVRTVTRRGMSVRDKLQFRWSLSFGGHTYWPAHLTLYGKRWNLYNNFGGSKSPKSDSRKAITLVSKLFPKTGFLLVHTKREAGTALYTCPFWRY